MTKQPKLRLHKIDIIDVSHHDQCLSKYVYSRFMSSEGRGIKSKFFLHCETEWTMLFFSVLTPFSSIKWVTVKSIQLGMSKQEETEFSHI